MLKIDVLCFGFSFGEENIAALLPISDHSYNTQHCSTDSKIWKHYFNFFHQVPMFFAHIMGASLVKHLCSVRCQNSGAHGSRGQASVLSFSKCIAIFIPVFISVLLHIPYFHSSCRLLVLKQTSCTQFYWSLHWAWHLNTWSEYSILFIVP